MSEKTPPEGKTWLTLEVPNQSEASSRSVGRTIAGHKIVNRAVGPNPKTQQQKAAEKFHAAGDELHNTASTLNPWGSPVDTHKSLQKATELLSEAVALAYLGSL